MPDDFEKLLEEEMRDPEFRREWEALEPEFNIIQAIIDEEKRSEFEIEKGSGELNPRFLFLRKELK